MASRVAILGGSAGAARAALTLAEMGIEVAVVAPSAALGLEDDRNGADLSVDETALLWPLLLRAASHPLISLHTNCEVGGVAGREGKFTVRAIRHPRYVREEICTSCGRCEDECSAKVISLLNGEKVPHSAIHAPLPGVKTVPSAFYIEKNGIAPCRAACPLGINVQGFVSLLSKGKVDEALALIHEAAPLAGVLGRVCTHPCEDGCKRGEVDNPVFIQALHRYAADNAPGGIRYTRKAPAGSKRDKIAIVGSGPAGLAAAWELARRGYNPTIFEAHGVVGGMLATGVPRFRLPHEVREREVAAIKAMGVDIRTGITVGRDVSVSDLRERGYKAFFLAIGAHENRKLNIPGENLEGVVDSMSLLFALNLKFGASVGSNVVVIGGGNSAVDSARTAKRRSKGDVRILYRRTAEEMTAVREEVEEAIKEGIPVDYLVAPVEIIGDGAKVTGVRCQRMELGEPGPDGRRKPEPIPGSEFDIDADHVVIAIGQRPDTSILNLARLDVEGGEATINIDPLTLETNVPGVFAGGDCVTGPNNVVDAVAAGLSAAVSIDRYLRGRNITKGRTMDGPQPVDVDVNERHVSHHKRSRMPAIPHSRRRGSFEEVNLGLPDDVAEREAGRCLNCALCSECMECERVCELNAVFHGDRLMNLDVGAEVVIDFGSCDGTPGSSQGQADSTSPQTARPGVHVVEIDEDAGLADELARASSVALSVATELGAVEETQTGERAVRSGPAPDLDAIRVREEAEADGRVRSGVALCRCGGSISSVVDFEQVEDELLQFPDVRSVQSIMQACTPEGAALIAAQAREGNLDRLVLAACRCCGLDQICFSCTDRRVLCQINVSGIPAVSGVPAIEFVNIREHCAKVHRDDPKNATRKALNIISAGIAGGPGRMTPSGDERTVEGSALVLGAGLRGLAAARDLTALGFSVSVISGASAGGSNGHEDGEHVERRDSLMQALEARGVHVMPWPQALTLEGSPGSYVALAKNGSHVNRIRAGALILDVGEGPGEVAPSLGGISPDSVLGHVLTRESKTKRLASAESATLRGLTIRETAGVFVMETDEGEPPDERLVRGSAIAAAASAYLRRGVISPRATAVRIDGRLCRGCGECAAICSLIEIRERDSGTPLAFVDETLCLGCGACVARCPTGAIHQMAHTDEQLASTLKALLGVRQRAAGRE